MRRLIIDYGRYLTILACLAIFVMWPALASLGLFLIVIAASLFNSARVAQTETFSILIFYLALYFVAMLYFNIPFPFHTKVTLLASRISHLII